MTYDQSILIGPLSHKLVRGFWVVDFSRPGALARYAAEENEWWSKNWDKDCVR